MSVDSPPAATRPRLRAGGRASSPATAVLVEGEGGNAVRRARLAAMWRSGGGPSPLAGNKITPPPIGDTMEDSDHDMTPTVATSAGGSSGSGAATSHFKLASDVGEGKREASDFLPWVDKYRPTELSDLVSQGEIVATVTKLIDAGRLPHLLFYGPPGTGKTTTVLALAQKLYGKDKWRKMTLELNASDDRGIDVVREQIKTFASTQKLFSTGVKLIILDEADAMTSDAQFALRRVIEKYTSNTRFCLLCNYVSKIIPALQSRCTRFRFAPLKTEDIKARLMYVAEKEGLGTRLRDTGVASILRLAGGDMRKVLNVLQATASGYDIIDEDAVYACTGNPKPADMRALLGTLLRKPFAEACTALDDNATRGFALTDMISELARLLAATDLPPEVRILLLDKICDIEYRLAFGTSDKLQGAALVGAFQQARALILRLKSGAAVTSAGGRA